MIVLSATQNDILTYIRQSCAENVEPCVADICVAIGLSFATVSRAVGILYGYGLLTRYRSKQVDSYVYSPAVPDDDICTAEAYNATRRCRTEYAQCTGIAINQEPIPPLAWRR